jgi:putative hydrolase of the HAD superfamily
MATIYFDLDGTLLTYGEDFRTLFDRAIDKELSENIYDDYVSHIIQNLEDVKQDPYIKAFESIRREHNLNFDSEKVAKRYVEVEIKSTEIHSGVKSLLSKLSENHKIGILTNGDSRVQKMKVEEHNLRQFVDEVLISNELGCRKPEKEIFEIAKNRLRSENYIYVGDTFDEDIRPARKTGFKTIYINGERESDLEAQNTRKLIEIMNLMMK